MWPGIKRGTSRGTRQKATGHLPFALRAVHNMVHNPQHHDATICQICERHNAHASHPTDHDAREARASQRTPIWLRQTPRFSSRGRCASGWVGNPAKQFFVGRDQLRCAGERRQAQGAVAGRRAVARRRREGLQKRPIATSSAAPERLLSLKPKRGHGGREGITTGRNGVAKDDGDNVIGDRGAKRTSPFAARTRRRVPRAARRWRERGERSVRTGGGRQWRAWRS